MGAAGAQGPPVRNIHIQIPPTDLFTFPYSISLENLIKDQSIFSLMVILSAILDRPFHVFFFSTFDMFDKLGKIHQNHWKKHPKISKTAKFER